LEAVRLAVRGREVRPVPLDPYTKEAAGIRRRPSYRGLNRFLDPRILFSGIAVLLLAAIWTLTIQLSRLKQADATHAAAVSTRELLGTYEAQMVRALREIDQTLNLIKLWRESGHGGPLLTKLAGKGLLPPDLIFTESIVDRDGNIVDSTQVDAVKNVAGADFFRGPHDSESLFISSPMPVPGGGSLLHFSRRLDNADGSFGGVVVIAVDASYFTSGYDGAKLGSQGVLGVVGSDGVVRARRTGDSTSFGKKIDYAALMKYVDVPDADPGIATNSGDGIRRWTSARELYGAPLAVFVGLSVEEQLRTARAEIRSYVWRAILGSVLVIVLMTLLGRQSWLLAQSRIREAEARIAHAERVEYMAYHDALTGLPNRSMFSRLLSQRIADSAGADHPLAVAFLDLDRFKQINDTLGHEAGDQLLKEVAVRLKACVRDSDTVARLGGDEFVMLLSHTGDDGYVTTVAQRILALTAKPFTLIGQEFRVTASIGISTYPQDGRDEQTLTKNADIAMYQAKAEGKNNFQFYSEKLNANSLERLTFESSLRHALERNEFRLHYQAKRDIHTGQICGMEALLRWEHPDIGLVEPKRFLPIAEETGLTVPIGKWVLKTACAQNVAWQKLGLPSLSIALNLSSRQFFDEHLLEDVKSTLAASGMAPNLLEFEIGENVLIRDIEATARILTALKNLGIRVAIDDFGTGYTTLATLRRLPLDTIKIDRAFIGGIVGNPESAKLADAVIAMGKTLGLTIVAQGIETREQADFLRAHACDEIQGFYFNWPLPAEQFRVLLTDQGEITYRGQRLSGEHG
jgi:diguanylate cyclase (GGDEF)-like protein